jgi:hypothetical protein
MAQQIQVLLIDDLDGSEATETVTFGLDGVSYEIDLNSGNATRFRKDLVDYIEHARKVKPVRTGATKQSGTKASSNSDANVLPDGYTRDHIKAFAEQRGLAKVNDRGRIPGKTLALFKAAMNIA